ncbi:hypothetical protein PC128_g22976 [Phytophthora cactorum]|nr:hypothetical protein PC128_g22976 [Phytophthora cactorum]
MLEEENVSMVFVQASILLDKSGKRLAATMDRCGFYLATNEGKKGKVSRNTATSYHRNVELWLFDQYPHLRVPTELILLKQGKTLDKHFLKREKGGLINKAPPCTKEDLQSLIRYLYSTARVNGDYQDTALACLMWHCFGRSSDLGYIKKQHVSVSADGAFYLRLLRVKTAEEQGLSLILDKSDFLTCPLHPLAIALATQDAPCSALLKQLPNLAPNEAAPVDSGVPLLELLEAEPASLQDAAEATPSPDSNASSAAEPRIPLPASTETQVRPSQKHARTGGIKRGEDGVQSYVNRLLKRVAEPAGATVDLTSHSFRRGGAQHANGDDRLAAQWIFDRGAWDMTKTSKAFAFITNTAREDRIVARVLSGWSADDAPKIIDIASLDHASQERLGRLRLLLFSSYKGTGAHSPRSDACGGLLGITSADLLAWSVALNNEAAPPAQDQEQDHLASKHICPSIDHLRSIIEELISVNKTLTARLTIVEAALLKPTAKRTNTEVEQAEATSVQEPKLKRRKKQTTNLSSTWYEWYTRVPRVWDSTDRQKKPKARHVVAFMKLFLDGAIKLDNRAEDYKDQVLDAGSRAQDAVLIFLNVRGTNAKGAESVLRALRPLHKTGVLDERVIAYKRLLAIDSISDPAPVDTHDILAVVGHV